MSEVRSQHRQSLAVLAKVGVMANGTFVSVSHNVFILVDAERAITEDTNVTLVASGLLGHWLV